MELLYQQQMLGPLGALWSPGETMALRDPIVISDPSSAHSSVSDLLTGKEV